MLSIDCCSFLFQLRWRNTVVVKTYKCIWITWNSYREKSILFLPLDMGNRSPHASRMAYSAGSRKDGRNFSNLGYGRSNVSGDAYESSQRVNKGWTVIGLGQLRVNMVNATVMSTRFQWFSFLWGTMPVTFSRGMIRCGRWIFVLVVWSRGFVEWLWES